ncbi:MAG: BrnT family toxin [Candidatus Promineifilaceae bacterium]
MKVEGFIWLEQYVDKLETKHNVTPEEAEEVFYNNPSIRKVEKGYRRGEHVYRALGRTMAGRYLFVLFIYKPSSQYVLVVSARDMDESERKSYDR